MAILGPEAFEVMRRQGTEYPWTSALLESCTNEKTSGIPVPAHSSNALRAMSGKATLKSDVGVFG